jgi:2-furoyl-CoA dehydrogenase large subunit
VSETTIAPEQVEVEAPAEPQRWAGQSLPRKEDGRLLQGQGVFVDDIKRHNMGYAHYVRSPYGHAVIKSVDVSAALAVPGVYGTLTGDEVATLTDPFFQIGTAPGSNIKDYALAVGRVRFVGDPVAIVVAETRELARDAAELVEVDYEPLEANTDPRRALDSDVPVMHQDAGSNLVWEGVYEWGSWDDAVAEADRIVKIPELHFDRFNSTPLECDGALVEYNRGIGQWTIYCNNQFPGFAAIMMGPAMRTGLDRLRFVTQDIGGGFGNKITSHPQLVAMCLLARKLNRAINWTEWRTEFHLSMSHGNERYFQETEIAVKNDGTMLGYRTKALDDAGAFTRYEPLGGVIWAQVTPGMYRWKACRLDFTQVVTNKAPCSPNRGYSRMQHLWFTERVMDLVAHELDLDPVEVRKRNYIRADEMPYTTPNGCVYDSGDYAGMLDLALGLLGPLDERRAEAERAGKLLGVGIGSTLDSGTNNFGQSRLINPELQFSGNNEVATVKLDIFGEIVVTLGTTPQGQGHETTSSMIVADILGCDPSAVNVRTGHDSYWNSHAGFSGTYASQFAVTGLSAVKGAAEALAADIKALAAGVLGADGPDGIVLEGGFAKRADNPEAALPFFACGAIINANNAALPEEARELTLNKRYVYVPPFEVPDVEKKYGNLTLTYAAQVHVAVIEVDPETGSYEVVDYAAVDDCGTRIHPQIVEGQVMGALAHGLGAATHETFTYDEDGNLLTPNFYDYHVPHAMDVPPLKTGAIESPSPFTPLGTKGMGEGGGAAIHAVCAALQDALKPLGAPVVSESCNPPFRVWKLIQDPASSRQGLEVVEA